MKKLGILMVVMILASTISMAQNRRGGGNFDPEERAKQTTEQMKEALDLKKDQEKKVYELNLKMNKEMMAMREEMRDRGGFEGMREKMTKMREANDKEMKKILSADQWKKYEKWQEERRSRRGQGRDGGQGGRR